jgi:plasmid replication initiation protein
MNTLFKKEDQPSASQRRYGRLYFVEDNRLVFAGGDFSSLELKIFHILVSEISKEDTEFHYHRLAAKDVAALLHRESDGRFYKELAQAAHGLMGKSFWVKLDDGTPEEINIMSKCNYIPGHGVVRAKFNEDMRPYLLDLQNQFTRFRLWEILPLKSQYSIRMFAYLMSFCKMRRHDRITIGDLRFMMGCTEKYSRDCDFRYRVIDKPKEEIEEHCTISFDYTEHKERRQTTGYTFKVENTDKLGAQTTSSAIEAAPEQTRVPENTPDDKARCEHWYDQLEPSTQRKVDDRIQRMAEQRGYDWSNPEKRRNWRIVFLADIYQDREDGGQLSFLSGGQES